MISGRLDLPTAFDPVSWHAREALFGQGRPRNQFRHGEQFFSMMATPAGGPTRQVSATVQILASNRRLAISFATLVRR